MGQEPTALDPELVGKVVATALTTARSKVRYVVPPSTMQGLVMKLLSKRTVDRIIGKAPGLLPS